MSSRWLALPALLAAAYGVAFIAASAYSVAGQRWFLLLDDAMISMKYAQTFARGEGLVWFPGAARVQGFTNPLWTLVMAGVQLFPWSPAMVSLPMQVLGLGCVVAAAVLAGRLYWALAPRSPLALLPSIAVALYFPLHYWAELGMEAGFLTALLLGLVLAMVDLCAGSGRWQLPAALFAVGVATRLDFAIYAAPAAAACLVAHSRGTLRAGAIARLGGSIVAALLAVLVAQKLYYGDWVPNTAQLKLGVKTVVRLGRGAATSLELLRNLSLAVSVAAAAALLLARSGDASRRLLVGGSILIALAYNTWVGGDAWESELNANRFLLPVVPLVLVSAALILEPLRLRGRVGALVAAAVGVFLVARINLGTLGDGAAVLRHLEEVGLTRRTPSRAEHDWKMLKAGLLLREAIRPGATVKIAVSSAGIAPFLIGDAQFIDLLGKSDRRIARMPPVERDFLPGHMKWDFDYSIGELQPDLVIGNWSGVRAAMPPGTVELPGLAEILVRPEAIASLIPASNLVEVFQRLDYGPEEVLTRNLEAISRSGRRISEGKGEAPP